MTINELMSTCQSIRYDEAFGFGTMVEVCFDYGSIRDSASYIKKVHGNDKVKWWYIKEVMYDGTIIGLLQVGV